MTIQLPDRESGFTLIELMVVCLLLVAVLSVVGGIFYSTITAQQKVDKVTTSADTAQSAASTIDDRIRNASEFRVTSPVAGDQLLVARAAGTGATVDWACYGWYYSSSAHTLRMTTTTPGTKITAPTTSQLASWTLLASGVTPPSGSSVFTQDALRLTVAFDVSAGSTAKPTGIRFTTAALTGASGAGTCY
jgi:Tfp pilus assembly protein PilW